MIRYALVLSLVILALGATAARGQEDTGAPREERYTPPTFDVDFAGGTAAEYLAALRRKSPEMNIIEPVELARVEMQPVKLHGVDAAAAVYLLDEVFHQAGDEQIYLKVDQIQSHPQTSPVYRVTAQRSRRGEGADSKVWSLVATIEAGVSSDDVLTAIEAALDLFEGYRPARLRFHPETGLLIARAAPSQLETIDSIVSELYAAHRRTSRADQKQMQSMEAKIGDLHAEAEAGQRETTEWRTRAELIQRELDRRDAMVSDLEDELQAYRMRIGDLEVLVRQLEDRIARQAPPPGSGAR